MKIKQLDIAGFRSLKNVSWQPGDLNVVIGQNGTGKSNLLRMLELIAASAEGQLSNSIRANGGMQSMAWDGNVSQLNFHITATTRSLSLTEEVCYEVKITSLGGLGLHSILKEILTYKTVSSEQPAVIIEMSNHRGLHYDQIVTLKGAETGLSHLARNYANTSVVSEDVIFREQLSGINVYHDLDVGRDSKIRQAPVVRYDTLVESDGQNFVTTLHTLYTQDRDFERNIDLAMSAAFDGAYEKIVFAPAADQRVQPRVRWKTLNRAIPFADLSDGTLRFLFLLTVLKASGSSMLIAIDEPETGLHPSMLPIIAEFAVEASSHTQVVFTTHSPQFLDAFTATKPTTTVARWENGETKLDTLDGEELKYWLAEYSLGELFKSGELEALTT